MVPGEQISAKTMCSSSQTVVVPLGERLGVPSSQTEATKPSRCSLRTRCMSAVSLTELDIVHFLLWNTRLTTKVLKHLFCSQHNEYQNKCTPNDNTCLC